MDKNVDNAERIVKALTASETLALFVRLNISLPQDLVERVNVQDAIARTGRCCSLFNGYHQRCRGTKYNIGHSHPCTGCHDCASQRFPLDNDDVYWLKRWYQHGDDSIWNKW